MSDSFEFKKWLLFTLCLIQIVTTLVITIVLSIDIDYAQPWTQDYAEHLRAIRGVIIAVGVILVLIQMLGLFGAFMENFFLTLIYAIIMVLASGGCIALGIKTGSTYWVTFSLNVVITILAFLVAFDFKDRENDQYNVSRRR